MDFYNKLKKVFSCLLLLGLLCSTAAAADSDSTGDRIWDKDFGQNETYTWNYLSYSGFYYDLDSGLGSEEMKIEDIGRTIDEGKLIYTTEPLNTDFEFKKWGEYQVIGFMAEKYFAGYLEASDLVDEDVSLIQDGALSKILLDSDESISVHTGSSLELKEGYSLYIAQVDINGEKVWVQLKKDDKVVDEGFIGSKQNYIYEADLGDAE
ncbi:MAG: S-layer protein domain-containing protein, partial [Methanosarcinaceae archaeon]|nr:S-layer protein domain-containing protein [Methanosarcinaceae archaeon]